MSVFGIFVALFLFGSFILFVAGGIDALNSHRTDFPLLVGVGFGLSCCGMIVCVCGCLTLQARYNTHVRETIAAESIKYSSRSPTPCSWRLGSTAIYLIETISDELPLTFV